MKNVGIIGVQQSNYGQASKSSLEEMIFEISQKAVASAGMTNQDIESIVIASNDQVDGRAISIMVTSGSVGAYGKDLLDTPSSSEHAVALGYLRLLAGVFETSLVVSWSSLESGNLPYVQHLTCEPLYQRRLGLHDLASYGLQAAVYLSQFRIPAEAAAEVVVKNRAWGQKNALAHLRKEVTAGEVQSSPYSAWPLRKLMVPPDSAGVVAFVLASEKKIKALGKKDAAWIRGVGWASDSYWIGERNLGELASLKAASGQAYKMAGVKDPVQAFDVAEIHDVTAYHELMAYEALGFCPQGGAGKFILGGGKRASKRPALNPSGGALSANPYFATGMVRIAEAALQVMGQAQDHQVPEAKSALAQATSGFSGQNNTVFILSKDPL